MAAKYSRLDSEPKRAEVSEMANFRDSTRASSDDSFPSDDEGLLKHKSDPEGTGARSRKAPWPIRHKWPVAHLFLMIVYTMVFIIHSYSGFHAENGEIHLVSCKCIARDDLSQIL